MLVPKTKWRLRMKAILAILLGGVLAGALYAQQPAQENHAQAKPAIVHFYGDGHFGVRHVPLYIDGNKVGNLHGNEVLDVPVVAGKHALSSGDKKSGVFLEAADGGEYYVKVTLSTGGFVPHGQVALIDPSQGQFEVEARRKDH